MTNPLNQTTNRTYDAANRLVTVANTLGNRTSFAYDKANNQVRVQNALGQISTTVYRRKAELPSHWSGTAIRQCERVEPLSLGSLVRAAFRMRASSATIHAGKSARRRQSRERA